MIKSLTVGFIVLIFSDKIVYEFAIVSVTSFFSYSNLSIPSWLPFQAPWFSDSLDSKVNIPKTGSAIYAL